MVRKIAERRAAKKSPKSLARGELEPGSIRSRREIYVNRTMLSRRHKRAQAPNKAKNINQQKLNPQQEQELIRYITKLIERYLPSSREMIKNFTATIAKEPVSESWVTRFITQHSTHLIS
ncbi:hypothetical protein PSPO01_12805 [Paraphaeosphaeria sporulosa]